MDASAWTANFKNIKEFAVGEYIVEEFRLRETKFGTRVTVLIGTDHVFLPARFAKYISTQEKIDELNGSKYSMFYGGQKNKTAIINFKPKQ